MYLKALSILSVLGLCACGGGGGNSSPPLQFPLDSTFSAYQQMNETFNLTATSGADTYTLQITLVPGQLSTFGGVSAFTATKTVSLSENGNPVSNDVQTEYFTTSPYTLLGADDSNGQVTVYANQKAISDTATTGQSGPFNTYTTYTDNTQTTVYATGTTTWSLEGDASQVDADLALACMDTTGTVNNAAFSESDCYLVDLFGSVLTLQVTMTVNGQTLVFQ